MKQQWVTFNHLSDALQLDKISRAYVWNSLVSQHPATSNPNHLMALVEPNTEPDAKNHVYGLLPNAIIQYVDFLEIVEARKTATAARESAGIALEVSVTALVASIILGLAAIVLQIAFWVHHKQIIP